MTLGERQTDGQTLCQHKAFLLLRKEGLKKEARYIAQLPTVWTRGGDKVVGE